MLEVGILRVPVSSGYQQEDALLAMDPRVAEAVWKGIEGHLPPRPPDMHPLGCHRLPIPDRDCFQGILVRLARRLLLGPRSPALPGTPDHPARPAHRMAGRQGVRQARRRSHRRLRQDHRPWTYPRSPSTPSLHKAPCGGEGTGPNPTDRAKIGWKWSVATDLFADPHRLGHRRRRTATTPSCSNPPCRPSPTADSCWTLRPCTWTAATTATSPRNAARPWGSPTSSAPRRNARAKRRSRNRSLSDCAGPLNAPTPGSQTLVSCAATPIGSAGNDWDRSHSPWPSSSP